MFASIHDSPTYSKKPYPLQPLVFSLARFGCPNGQTENLPGTRFVSVDNVERREGICYKPTEAPHPRPVCRAFTVSWPLIE